MGIIETKKKLEEEMRAALLAGDHNVTLHLLQDVGLLKDGDEVLPHNTTTVELAMATWRAALTAIYLRKGKVDYLLLRHIISCTADLVDIFSFVRLVVASDDSEQVPIEADQETADESAVDGMADDVAGLAVGARYGLPKTIREALMAGAEYDQGIAEAIEDLHAPELRGLLLWIASGAIRTIHLRYNRVLIRAVSWKRLLPNELIFAYMALCPRDVVREIVIRAGLTPREMPDSVDELMRMLGENADNKTDEGPEPGDSGDSELAGTDEDSEVGDSEPDGGLGGGWNV